MQFQASTFCEQLLRSLEQSDPFAAESIQRARDRVAELFAPMHDLSTDAPDGRTVEDIVNYLGAEILALVILTADLECDPRDFVDALSEQINGLISAAQK